MRPTAAPVLPKPFLSPYTYPGIPYNKTVKLNYLTVNDVILQVCKRQQITVEQFNSKSRLHALVYARQLACYFSLKYIDGITTTNAAHRLGIYADHTTAIYSRDKILNDLMTMPELAAYIKSIDADLVQLNALKFERSI